MLQYSGIYLQLSVCLKILASSKHLGWRTQVTNHLRSGKRRIRVSITNYMLGSPTAKKSRCCTRMWEKKDRGLRVSNYKSNIRIILGQLTSKTCMNTINFEEGQLLKYLQVTLVFQPSLKRSLDQSFLQTLEESLANIFTHHKHLLQSQLQKWTRNRYKVVSQIIFYTGRCPIKKPHSSKEA